MERSLFFNSAPGDPRIYQASDFADYFGSVLFTGLLHVDGVPGLAVNVETGTLDTVVSPGGAIMEGYLYENTSEHTLTHAIPEATLDRIDRIVLRLDLRNSERNIRLHVKAGTAATSPVPPTLQRDNFIYELSLAQIRVRANTVQLLQSDLIDERLDEGLCGLVKSLINDGITEITFDEHLADHTDHVYYADDTGTANAKVVTISPTPTSYKKGLGVSFTNSLQNTGAVTININGLGAKSILRSNGTALTSGNLRANSVYTVRYNGTNFILQGEGGEYGTAIAGDVRAGKTIGTQDGLVTGTLPVQTTTNITPTFSSQTFPAGIYPTFTVAPSTDKKARFENVIIPATSYYSAPVGFVPLMAAFEYSSSIRVITNSASNGGIGSSSRSYGDSLPIQFNALNSSMAVLLYNNSSNLITGVNLLILG
ncbi:hypothetical protein M3231_11840 [Neobacillus mesonae]|nr:hypothetical protein [Neobacillus mesonae]